MMAEFELMLEDIGGVRSQTDVILGVWPLWPMPFMAMGEYTPKPAD